MTLVIVALALLLQTPSAPPRDVHVQSEPRAGKGVLRGRVLDAQSGHPIRGATVTAYWQTQSEPPSTVTDAEGRWEIAGLMSGEYHVGASKGGYVDRLDFGNSIGLTETQPERSVDLKLARGAVLSGRVIDGDGEPEVGVQLVALAEGPTSRGRRGWSMAAGGVATDDRGMFRIFGLAAGEYILVAQRQDRSPARAISRGQKLTYVPTYYPGTTELAEAQRFTLDEAAEYNDLTFATQTLPSVSVSGRVVVSSGRIRHGFTTMMQSGDRPEHMMEPFGSKMVEPDGTFRIPFVTAGMYRLGVRVDLSNGEHEVGQLDLTAGDEDISGLVVSTHGPTTLSGRVVVEPVGARRPEIISVNARPLVEHMEMGGQEEAMVNADGTFELKVFHSPVKLYQSGRLEGWAQTRVRWKGNDVSGGITFEPGQRVEGIEVVLRRAASRLTGSVSGASVPGDEREGVVIAFREGGDDPAGLGVAGMVPIRDGRYALGPLPASEYQLVAVRSADPNFFQRIEFVELLRARATTVSVGDNETKTVNLTLITEYLMRIVFPACVIGLGSVSTWAVASLFLGTSGPHFPRAWPFHDLSGPSAPQAIPARVSVGPGKGVIRGRVLDATTGRPVPRVRIWVQSEDGRQSWEAETAGEGTWEIAGLSESAYLVGAHRSDYQPFFAASPPVVLSSRRLERTLELKLSHGASFGGRVTVDGRPAAGVEVRVLRVTKGAKGAGFQFEGGQTQTDETGRYRLSGLRAGQYVLAAMGGYLVRHSRHSPVTTLYPGTISANEARRFDVKEGTVVNDLRIALKSLPAVRVSGQVVSSTGAPLDAIVSYGRRDQPFLDQSLGTYGPQGGSSFSLPPLTAGRYRVTAKSAHGIGRPEAASLDITVGDTDIWDLVLQTVPAAIIRGRVVTSSQYDSWSLDWMRLIAMPEDIRESSDAEHAVVGSDRTFEIQTHHFPARVVVIQPTGGWDVGSIRWRGREVADGVLAVEPGATMSDVKIVLRRRTSVVQGTVNNPTVCNLVVVLQRRKDGTPACVASSGLRDGEFRTRPLPAGEYRIAATDASPATPLSPARLWDAARPLTLDDDKTVTLTLDARPRP